MNKKKRMLFITKMYARKNVFSVYTNNLGFYKHIPTGFIGNIYIDKRDDGPDTFRFFFVPSTQVAPAELLFDNEPDLVRFLGHLRALLICKEVI